MKSTKSITDHLFGDPDGIETVFTSISINKGLIPPTIKLENPEKKCATDYVSGKTQQKKVRYAMINVLILKKRMYPLFWKK
jgi:3-oxoacyl-[acyl-carrier-protein] synthase II